MTRSQRLRRSAERAIAAQEDAARLKDAGRLRWVADDRDCPDLMRLAALAEELGEVARSVHDGNRSNLIVELAQLAGIAIAWESLLHEERRLWESLLYEGHVVYSPHPPPGGRQMSRETETPAPPPEPEPDDEE
jgi:hypothetical protein